MEATSDTEIKYLQHPFLFFPFQLTGHMMSETHDRERYADMDVLSGIRYEFIGRVQTYGW